MTFHNLQNGSVGFSCSAPQHRAVRASQLTAAHGRGDGRSMTWNNTGQIWPPKPIRDGRFCIYHTIRRTPPSRAWTSNFADLIVGHPSGSVHALIWQITMDKRIVIIGVAYLPESSASHPKSDGVIIPVDFNACAIGQRDRGQSIDWIRVFPTAYSRPIFARSSG